MRMLKHEPTGRTYVFSEQLARAEGMVEFNDPGFGQQTEPTPAPVAPIPEPEPTPEPEPEDETMIPENVPAKALDEMTRDELLAVAEQESELRGDGAALSRMKKADLIAYITGQPGEGA